MTCRPHEVPAFRHPALLSLGLLLFTSHATAEPMSPAPSPAVECREGNLLVGATAISSVVPASRLALLGDGFIAPNGAPWPDPSVLLTLDEPLTLELPHPSAVTQVVLQIDADQAFELDLSMDGTVWTRIPAAALDVASGMQVRTFDIGRTATRYVRLAASAPSAPLAVSELRLHCGHQSGPPEQLSIHGDHAVGENAGIVERTLNGVFGIAVSPTAVNVAKTCIAVLMVAWMALAWILRRIGLTGSSTTFSRAEHLVLGALAVAGVLAYFNFGAYRYPSFIHDHDVFHYFVGAKYFPEIGYDDLYRCSAVAEAEAGFPQRVALRAQRDLRDNRLVSGAEELSHGAECKRHFTPARWATFARDVSYFADARGVPDWHRMMRDHGFNASPTWIALGAVVARAFPADDATIGGGPSLLHGVVGPLDPFLLAGALAAIVWAFGFRTACVVAIVFGTNPMSDFSWVGGSFLRQAWLALLVVGICLLRRNHLRLGGVAVALAALLQLFPIACLCGVALGALIDWRKTSRIHRDALRVLGAAAVTVVLAVPLSAWGSGRAGAWTEFAANTRKHADTPVGNYVGLKTALSFRPSTRVALLFDENAVDPFARAQAARIQNLAQVRPIYVLGILLGLWGVVRACRGSRPSWLLALLGLPLTAFALETSCYYAAWMAVLALAGAGNKKVEGPMVVTLLAFLAIELMGLEIDTHYAVASGVLVLGMGGVLVVLGEGRQPLTPRP